MVLSILIAAALFFQGDVDELNKILRGEFTAPQPLSTIRIINWNIDRGTRLEEVIKTLEGSHPDLCLLQEVDLYNRRSGDRNIADQIAQRLQLNYAVAPSFQELGQATSGKPAYQGQAILTKLPILGVRILRFKTQSGWWKPRAYLPNVPIMQRRLGGRSALVAELKGAYGIIVVYSAHLESRSTGKIQYAQMREILDDARNYPENTPIVLAGDFNTLYTAKGFLEMLNAAGYHSVFGNQTPRTHKIVGNIDWIVVRGAARSEDASVVMNAQGSDHFPVAATVVLLPAPAKQ